LVVPNDELVSGRIVNESRLTNRRGEILLPLRLDTSTEKLKHLPEVVKTLIDSFPRSTCTYVGLVDIKDQALHMEITYSFHSSDRDKYKRNHHIINVAVLELLASMAIEIAPRYSFLLMKESI
jgi:hypothetical protein